MPERKRGRHRHKLNSQDLPNIKHSSLLQSESKLTLSDGKENPLKSCSTENTAKNTERRSWVSSQKLRHSSISFTSLSKESPVEHGDAYDDVSNASDHQCPNFQSPMEHSPSSRSSKSQAPRSRQKKGERLQNTMSNHAVSGSFSEPSNYMSVQIEPDSEEEVILFRGRNSRRPLIQPRFNKLLDHSPGSNIAISRANKGIHEPYRTTLKFGTRSESSGLIRQLHSEKDRSRQWSEIGGVCEDAIADYAENVKSNGLLTKYSAQHASPQHGDIESIERSTNTWSFPSVPKPSILQRDEGDLADFYDLSTSDDATDAAVRIVRRRERESSIQYLVVRDGKTVDEASWTPSSRLISPRAREAVLSYERAMVAKVVASEQTSTSDMSDVKELAIGDIKKDTQKIVDHEDTFNCAIESMTDDHIARLFSKQEELVLGSNEPLLFDSLDFTSVTGAKASQPAYKVHQPSTVLHQHSVAQEATNLGYVGGEMSTMDQYGDYDIMDFSRPSLQRQTKGRKAAPPAVSDEELERSVKKVWSNDRVKKKLRKEARDEARSQGLLGKKGKSNFTSSSLQDMTASRLKLQVQSFLLSDQQSLSLSPMDKSLRRLTHEIANRLSLRSKSVGVGHRRFPQLFKTSLTQVFDELSVHDMDILLTRRSRCRQGGLAMRNPPTKPHRVGGSVSAAAYRDGEVVGAEAPELGLENKGRAMLEKMGWSKGTALGALNNKGILQPVSHVVKTTKAGLG